MTCELHYIAKGQVALVNTACPGHHNLNCTEISMERKKESANFLNPLYKDSVLLKIDTW